MNTKIFLIMMIFASVFVITVPFTFLQNDQTQKKFNEQVLTSAEPTIDNKKVKVKPLHNVKLPDFGAIKNVAQKKRAFFDYIRPAVEKRNAQILSLREKLTQYKIAAEQSLLTQQQRRDIHRLVLKYRINDAQPLTQQINSLLDAVDIVPAELVLSQAANESAWGTSRFAREGLNFFGIWCFKPNCGMVPNARSTGEFHEVKAFKSVQEAVDYYFLSINRNKSYKALRDIRADLRHQNKPITADQLADGLLQYSSRGADYVAEIKQMIRHNQNYFGIKTSTNEVIE